MRDFCLHKYNLAVMMKRISIGMYVALQYCDYFLSNIFLINNCWEFMACMNTSNF